MWTMWWNVFYWKQLEDAHEISRWVKALFLEKVLTYADVVQKFSHVGSVWRSMWPLLTEERPSACELCAKTFSSGHNQKMHMKVHAEWKPSQCRHWINCDKHCIKTTVWICISFSTAERRVQSVTPHKRKAHDHVNNVLRWVFIWNNIKTHFRKIYFYWSTNWTSAVCTILCLFNWKFWSNWSHNWHKLGPMISPHGGDNMLARFEAGVNTFPHISQIKIFFVNHLYLLNEESQNVPLYGKTKLWTRAFI